MNRQPNHSRLLGALRSFLLILVGLGAVQAVEAQAYNWKPVQIHGGGFVTGIVPHPNVSGLMYCRTDIGGAYRWNAANGSWIPLLDFLGYPNNEWSLNGVESIGLDAQDPNRLYLTCGWLGNPSQILISTNQGASFTRINSPFIFEANSDGRGNGERMAVDPNLGGTLFYGTRRDGLWKSVNHGANWAKVNSFPVSTTTNNIGLSFVEFVKTSGAPGSATPVLWVGVSQGGTNLFRSTDGGATWTGITNGAPADHMPLRAAQDGVGNMYVTFGDGPGPNGISAGVVRKYNLTTLTSINVTPPTGQGGFGGVSVDRQNPNIVVVTTADRWWPMSDIYRSTNGGTNWTSVYNGTADTTSAPWMNGGGVQGWMFDIKIDPFDSNRAFYVTGGGVFSSFNFASTTPSWEFRSTGIEENAFFDTRAVLRSPPSGPQLFTALGDMGGFAHYDLDSSPPTTNIFTPVHGSNTSIDFAEQDPSIVVRTHWGTPRGARSTDGGRTWTDFATHPAAADANNVGVIAISADGSRLVWVSPGFAPFYSTDNGSSWTQCSGAPAPPNSWEQSLLHSDRVNPNKFYLYMRSSGRIYISTDGGASFSAGATTTSWADDFQVTFGQEGHLWLAANNGLRRSTNSGVSFSQVAGVQIAHMVGFGRPNGGVGYPVIYLHGQINNTWGLYRSEDQGTNWTRINDNQHQYGNIQQITGDPKIYGRCYIAAGGRGILYGDIPDQPPFTPANLTATLSGGAVQLSWNNAVGADSYLVKRGTISGGAYTTIASGVTQTSYLDTGLVNDTTYYYVVAATNAFGIGANSAEVSATPTELKALYTFDGNALDGSGNGNHGTPTSLTYVAGKVGSLAAQFNGSSASVTIPPSIIEDFTVAMWVKTTDSSGSAGAQWWSGKGLVDGEIGGGGADWGTSIVNGKFVLGVGSTGGDTTIASSTNINDGTWRHVAATRSNITGAIQVYVDGVLRGSGTGPTGSRSWPTMLRIGALQPGSNHLNGTLDDVRLYARVLNSDEIAQLAAVQLAAPQNVTATPGDATITLAWSAVAGASNYTISRAPDVGGPFTPLASGIFSLSHVDSSLADGGTWYYTVSANGLTGPGLSSAPVSATTHTAVQNWRFTHFGTIEDSAEAADAADPDGDGWTNQQEFVGGTNPNDRTSLLKIDQFQVSGNDMIIGFPTIAGRTYRVERSYTFETGSWVILTDEIVGTGEVVVVTDPNGADSVKRFYRIVVTR